MPESFAVNVNELLLAASESGSAVTGRKIITFRPGGEAAGVAMFEGRAGMRVANSLDFIGQAVNMEELGDADSVFLSEIGVAVTSAPDEQVGFGIASNDVASPVMSVEDEYFVFTAGIDLRSYLAGFRAAADRISSDLSEAPDAPAEDDEESVAAAIGATWGLTATRSVNSSFTGAGIRVAILDTGLDLRHPDFADRAITSQSFISGEAVQDLHSHGTHCTGTACGPRTPAGRTPRYGIAHQALIFIAKVLSNSGSGADGGILAGINWAVANRCHVVSMSLGGGGPVSAAYEQAAQRALTAGTVILAASGNESRRPGVITPTGRPANAPSIVAVAAVDRRSRMAVFSNGGKIDIAGPGVDTFSTVPMPLRYGTKSGTSMATPHVAGCAALLAQTSASLRGAALRQELMARARRIPLSASDAGVGLVQAP